MNINNLIVGEIYKNYKIMCEVLEEPILGGNSKKSQIKEWNRYFSYKNQGYKFVIEEIYDEPKKKEDNRNGGNNAVTYIEKIEKLILDLLVQENNKGKVFLSRNKLLETLRMINSQYAQGKFKPGKLSKYIEVSKEEITDFYETSDSMLQRNLEAALRRLRSKALITWKMSLTIGYYETQAPLNLKGRIKAQKIEELNVDGDIQTRFSASKVDGYIRHRKATVQEEQAVLRVEREVLQEMNLKSKQEAFQKGKNVEFYRTVTDVLFDSFNIYLYYNSYEIIFNSDHIFEEWEEIEGLKLMELEKSETQKQLNKDIIKRLNENAKNRHSNAPKKLLETGKNVYNIRSSNNYLENSSRLISELVNTNNKDKS